MRQSYDKQIAFLRSRDAAMQPHSFSDLLQHLVGTRAILQSWQAAPVLCTAGLFHSVYGTESFPVASVDPAEREVVRNMIGTESEEIVYLFSVMTRESFEANLGCKSAYSIQNRLSMERVEISPHLFRQLCNLSAANWLEQLDRLPKAFQEFGRERYRRVLKFALPAAAKALREAYNFPDYE